MKEPTEVEKSDFNGDGVIDTLDFILFSNAWGTTDPKYDLDGDGTVNYGDFVIFARNFGKTVDGG
ncbi:MAG: hypothetical protein F4032_05600 [Gemmatimonadetes bacterium]|nr:hypothetical protein [Gemmatimonadota bacterium]